MVPCGFGVLAGYLWKLRVQGSNEETEEINNGSGWGSGVGIENRIQ
jgi:hypothetical protein